MRNFKTTIIALVVLIVAIVVFICVKSFIGKDSEPDETDATSTSVSIFNIDTEKVTKVRALNEEEFSLYKTEDIWHCNSHLDMEVYSESVEDIIDDFASLKGNIITDFDSLSDYNINEKSPYTELELSDGTTYKLMFGTTDAQGSYRYVMVSGQEDTIFRVFEVYASKIMLTRGLLVKLNA